MSDPRDPKLVYERQRNVKLRAELAEERRACAALRAQLDEAVRLLREVYDGVGDCPASAFLARVQENEQ